MFPNQRSDTSEGALIDVILLVEYIIKFFEKEKKFQKTMVAYGLVIAEEKCLKIRQEREKNGKNYPLG